MWANAVPTAGSWDVSLAWVALSEKNFLRARDVWSRNASAQTMPVGERPTMTLEPTDHPLSLEQHGITMVRGQQLAEAALCR